MARLVLHCKKHNTTIDPILSTHHNNPHQCPLCSRHADSRGWDEYDDLVEKYHTTRALVFHIDVFLREHLNKYEGSLESNLRQRFSLVPHTSGYTPVTCSCSNCHSVFRFFNTAPTIQSAPMFCPYCGHRSITTTQDNELDCWETLANAHNLPIPMIQLMYKMFCQQNARTHFDDFVTLIREQMNAS